MHGVGFSDTLTSPKPRGDEVAKGFYIPITPRNTVGRNGAENPNAGIFVSTLSIALYGAASRLERNGDGRNMLIKAKFAQRTKN